MIKKIFENEIALVSGGQALVSGGGNKIDDTDEIGTMCICLTSAGDCISPVGIQNLPDCYEACSIYPYRLWTDKRRSVKGNMPGNLSFRRSRLILGDISKFDHCLHNTESIGL